MVVSAAARPYPTAQHLAAVPDPSGTPWAVPPPGLDAGRAARLLRQALVADVLGAAVDTGCSVSRLGVAVVRLAAHAVTRAAAHQPEEDDSDG